MPIASFSNKSTFNCCCHPYFTVITLGEATLRISGIELMKALDVRRVEEGPVRRGLLRRALGCTASDKEH